MNHGHQAALHADQSRTARTAVEGIRQLVADAERYQSDLDPFIALHTPDVVLVNIAGRRVLGRDVLRTAMQRALESSLANVLTRLTIQDIRFVRPDVAIVSCLKRVSDEREAPPEDKATLPSAGSTTFVVVLDEGAWRIASARTTPIAIA